MKKSILVLVASTAMVANFSAPAWSGMMNTNETIARYADDVVNSDAQIILASSDEDDDDDDYRGSKKRSHSKDDDDRYEDDDDDCDDDDKNCKGANNPAPAGTMAPPKNGLFNN